jgi:hypothetical protein
MQHVGAHELGLVIDGRVAEPVAVGAIDVASRCNFNKQLRDRLILEGDKIWFVSRHADTEMSPRKLRNQPNTLGQTRLCETRRVHDIPLCESRLHMAPGQIRPAGNKPG